ncbi:MAG TPA: hypothetical protein VFY61_03060 [Pyrinomonadaceae bacterium]|nr:hypothetical protein [Pyrinomonadaceae bacterium]
MIRAQWLPKQAHLTRIRPNQPQQHANRGRFTGAVWPKKTVNSRRRNQQIQIVNGDLRAKAAAQPARLDQVLLVLHR